MTTWVMALAIAAAAFLQDGMPLRSLETGDQSHIDEPHQAVARTTTEWEALWRRHAPGRAQPPVDFTRDMVAGVFLGFRPTAGYGVEIVSATPQSGGLVLRYRETGPSRDSITAQVITAPYHIVALPGAAGDVRFERVD